jgi:hypothetical protein
VAQAEPGWGDEPSVLILGNRREQLLAAEAAAKSVGARVLGTEPIHAALDRLSRQAAVDSILVELDETVDSGTDRLLEWVDHAARNDTTRPVVSFPGALIDYVSARITDGRVVLLSDPQVEDRAAQLGLLLAERKHKLHDQGVEADAERLRRLSEEVARIAGALAELSTSARSSSYAPVSPPPTITSEAQIDAEMVRNLIRVRRLREQFFPKDLFADPAWDMLLDLMAARLEQSRVAVSSLCIAAAVPATTALRWIRTLTEHGLFVRREDPEDGRRIFIELSDPAAAALTAYFQTIHETGVRIPSS